MEDKTKQKSFWKRTRRVMVWVLGIILIYVLLGNALHHWVYPFSPPDPATYPRAGDAFGSTYEGFHIRIIDIVDDQAVIELQIEPGAIGPPLHYHKGFAEEFVVKEGTLHIELADQIVQIEPGESYQIEPYTAHRPFNPGSSQVVVASDKPVFPRYFAACLEQVYPILDREQGLSLRMALQMSVIDPICDTHVAEAPKPIIFGMNLLLAPAARLMGYKNYLPKRSASAHVQ